MTGEWPDPFSAGGVSPVLPTPAMPNIPWPATTSSTRPGGFDHRLTSAATASAVGATNGTIALAKVTQSGWSGAILARPTDPPLRTKEAGLSRKSAVISGAPMKSTMLPIQAGDDLVRNTSDGGVRRYRLPPLLNEAIDRKASFVTSFSVGNWSKPPLLRNSPPALLPGDHRGPIRFA